jgi:hypothetical protein
VKRGPLFAFESRSDGGDARAVVALARVAANDGVAYGPNTDDACVAVAGQMRRIVMAVGEAGNEACFRSAHFCPPPSQKP